MAAKSSVAAKSSDCEIFITRAFDAPRELARKASRCASVAQRWGMKG